MLLEAAMKPKVKLQTLDGVEASLRRLLSTLPPTRTSKPSLTVRTKLIHLTHRFDVETDMDVWS